MIFSFQVSQSWRSFHQKIPLLKWLGTFYSLLSPFGQCRVISRLPGNHLGTEWRHAFNHWPQHPNRRVSLRFSSHHHRASFVFCIRRAVGLHPKGFPNVLSTHQSEGLEVDYSPCLCKQKCRTWLIPLQGPYEWKTFFSPLTTKLAFGKKRVDDKPLVEMTKMPSKIKP